MNRLWNRIWSVPRWVSLPVALTATVGLAATCYPGGLAAAYADVRDAHELTDTMDTSRRADRQLSGRLTRMRDRVEYKEELITALIRGETTLADVTDQFAEMNRSEEQVISLHQLRYGDLELTELAARNVLDYVDQREPATSGSSVLRSRLAAQFHERFGHPAPGW